MSLWRHQKEQKRSLRGGTVVHNSQTVDAIFSSILLTHVTIHYMPNLRKVLKYISLQKSPEEIPVPPFIVFYFATEI